MEYQRVLDEAVALSENGKLDEACMLLERNADLPKSPYQIARTEFIIGKYDEELDRAGVLTDHHGREDLLGMAADAYALGAKAAREIPDWVFVAQLKRLESKMCYGSNPYRKRFRRAYAAAQEALDAWNNVLNRESAADFHFGFKLADDLAVRSLMVVEDEIAIDALEQAATFLLKLRGRDYFDRKELLKEDLYLQWNWASLHHSMSKYPLALKRAFEARDKALDASDQRNYGRVNSLIAEIALDCLDVDASWHNYSPQRLLNVAEAAKDAAIEATVKADDEAGNVLAILVKARWLGRTKWRAERTAILEEAEKRAASRLDRDPLLFGRVEIAWGDEYMFRYMKRKSQKSIEMAREYYLRAGKRLRDVEALGLARVARKRLMRLHRQMVLPTARSRKSRQSATPSPHTDLSLN